MSPLDGEFVMAPSIIHEVSNPGDPITDMYWFSSPARLGAVPGAHFWMSFRPEWMAGIASTSVEGIFAVTATFVESTIGARPLTVIVSDNCEGLERDIAFDGGRHGDLQIGLQVCREAVERDGELVGARRHCREAVVSDIVGIRGDRLRGRARRGQRDQHAGQDRIRFVLHRSDDAASLHLRDNDVVRRERGGNDQQSGDDR